MTNIRVHYAWSRWAKGDILSIGRIMGSYLCITQVWLRVAYVIVILWYDDLVLYVWITPCDDLGMHYVYVGVYACDNDDIIYSMMNPTRVDRWVAFSNYFNDDVQK